MAKQIRRNPTQARGAQRIYNAQLTRLAKQVGRIIADVAPEDPNAAMRLNNLLRKYAETLEPWARTVAEKMVTEVNARDLATWRKIGVEISAGLKQYIRQAPADDVIPALVNVQVELIKSIPIEAAIRVNKLALEVVENGERSKSIIAEIMRSGDVAMSRAKLIARTEVARTAATLTQSRAQSIGSSGYIWRTSRDGDVRPSHKAMAGQFVAWDQPPTLDNLTGHAGCLPNCRCWAEVVIPK
jgi:SPP1 gp7 family putative phage head morphogenesis protein